VGFGVYFRVNGEFTGIFDKIKFVDVSNSCSHWSDKLKSLHEGLKAVSVKFGGLIWPVSGVREGLL
jgi:hypothetical protein